MVPIVYVLSLSSDLPLGHQYTRIIRMNTYIVVAVLALAGMAAAEKYTDRYDSIDIDEIISNRKLLVPYMKCILDQGRCTAEGRELKLHIKDAMETACGKCTDKQKVGTRKVVKHLRTSEKDYYKQLVDKYDPDGSLQPIYEPFLNEEN